MLLLHISDIHFKEPDCLDEFTDPDRPIRTRVMRDLEARLDKLGPVDGILVGGDIAFKAHPDEYLVAKKWLLELAELCGCSDNRIFVVPGNHDVDRRVIGEDVGVQNVQHRIATANDANREATLRAQLKHEQTGRDLFVAHSAYNAFAAPMNCQIYPKKIFWHQDIPLGGGVMLRINGLTSTLLSGKNGGDDKARDLYLSPLQTALDPVEDRVHLVLCHHPVDWFMDQDAADDALNARATFQLFGHKHRQRVISNSDYVRVLAGALNPSRTEPGYEPAYNLLRLNVQGGGPDRRIVVETHQFRYQPNPERFDPVRTAQGDEVFTCTIPFPGRSKAQVAPNDTTWKTAPPSAQSDTLVQPAVVQDVEASMGDERRRDLIHRFWKLDGDKKREIALTLGLITEDEIELPEPERYGTAFLRAGELGKLDELTDMVAKMEK
jgi:predicted MPP superfamily phosphohydrolase